MRLQEIQQQLSVPKNQYNSFAKFKFRSAEDILSAVKPLLGDSILTLTDEIVQIGERYYIKAKAVFLDEGLKENETVVTAYAREDFEKKGMDGSQITGTASSYARKYALNGLFLIDDSKDADTDAYSSLQGSTGDVPDIEYGDTEGFNKALNQDPV